MIEFIDLRVFAKLADLLSVSATARVLCMPKSTVSRSLTRLEEHLSVALIYRSNRKLALTDTGVLFADHAKKILDNVQEAEITVGRIRYTPRGMLRVSAPVTPGQFMVAPLVAEYLRRYPEVQVSLSLTSNRVEPLTDEMDVVIRTGVLEDSRLLARRLGCASLKLFATPAYILEHGEPLTPDDLCEHTLLDIADGPNDWRLTREKETTRVQVHARFLANDTSTIRTVVLAGLGLAWLPDYLCREDVADGRLVHVMRDWERGEREIHAVFPKHRTLSPKVRSFVDFLAENINA